MKLLLLFLAFITLSSAASNDNASSPFCTKGCPYLKSMDKDPKVKIDSKKIEEKCKTDPKIPYLLCFEHNLKVFKIMGKYTWAEICKSVCGN
ncbi:unnamed protein product [Cylicocyclus nassatus]|uniref:Uncharacterized protein n=1 Tax=Cylicocyclus nassatus TaxID=53992 RepID=A0AA36DQB4_CYLNA|nr:unnamed protein product [Cylicocyclus nassatus]